MKRPNIETIFIAIDTPPIETATAILNHIMNNYAAILESQFCRITKNQSKKGFTFEEDRKYLTGRDDLLARIERDGAGMWYMQINTEFLATDAYFVIYSTSEGTALSISLDGYVTDFLESEDTAHHSYLLFLERIASTIKSPGFVCGLYFDTWTPIITSDLENPVYLKQKTPPSSIVYFIGWHQNSLDDKILASAWDMKNLNAINSISGFCFVNMMGTHWAGVDSE
jgi:hypothetical protein